MSRLQWDLPNCYGWLEAKSPVEYCENIAHIGDFEYRDIEYHDIQREYRDKYSF